MATPHGQHESEADKDLAHRQSLTLSLVNSMNFSMTFYNDPNHAEVPQKLVKKLP